ncbi:hypothetical protein FB451DRAFT_1183297 [Mycena latifolia]|nr:hypothetical protein FB451DRAFT_1183297 [Mycena latifolia]
MGRISTLAFLVCLVGSVSAIPVGKVVSAGPGFADAIRYAPMGVAVRTDDLEARKFAQKKELTTGTRSLIETRQANGFARLGNEPGVGVIVGTGEMGDPEERKIAQNKRAKGFAKSGAEPGTGTLDVRVHKGEEPTLDG